MDAPQFSILPLPAALGMDNNSIIHEPQFLRIRPTSSKDWGLITDNYGRELINGKYNKGKVDFSVPGQVNVSYRLRPKANGFKRFFSESHVYILADSRGVDVATFTPLDPTSVRNMGTRTYEVDCVNGLAANGEKVRLTLRGSLYSRECALMFGGSPVVRIQRPRFMSGEVRQALYVSLDPQDIYDVVVAPGTDIVWASMIIWCLDFLYAAGTA